MSEGPEPERADLAAIEAEGLELGPHLALGHGLGRVVANRVFAQVQELERPELWIHGQRCDRGVSRCPDHRFSSPDHRLDVLYAKTPTARATMASIESLVYVADVRSVRILVGDDQNALTSLCELLLYSSSSSGADTVLEELADHPNPHVSAAARVAVLGRAEQD